MTRSAVLLAGLLLLTAVPMLTQRRRDPLNPVEIEQLRDTMLEPQERLKLYIKFTRDRMNKLEQMRADTKAVNRPQQTHDMLEDFLAVYDELNDNIEMYMGRKDDIRKPLKAIIEADTEFQAKLRAVKDSAQTDAGESQQYEFLLTSAIDTVDSSADDHRKSVAQVEDYLKHKKQKK